MASPGLLDGSLEPSVEEVSSPESLAPEWARLAERSGNVFGSWEWLSVWWKHYGDRHTLRIAACRAADGELVAVLPLYMESHGPLRMARFLGHGPGDELGPVCAPEHRAVAARALRRVLEDWGLDLLLAERLPGDAAWDALDAMRLESEASPSLQLETTSWEDFVASKSRNYRQRSGKLERRLARKHRLTVRETDAERLDADLDLLFRLHSLRWSAAESEFAGRHRAFHRAFATRAFELGWLRLRFLELDGRPAAVSYLLRFGRVDADYQTGRDPEFERDSVGFVLLNRAVRSAVEAGQREYRFLRGGEEYKYRLATHDGRVETLALVGGIRGRVAIELRRRLRGRSRLWRGAIGAKRLLGRA
jgi:CelD/BcsL family acetyltransferase involved in cellulose biosynthesis